MPPQRSGFVRTWFSFKAVEPAGPSTERSPSLERRDIDTDPPPLDRLCTPPANWREEHGQRINPSHFNEIAKFLETADNAHQRRPSYQWSQRPRLYTVLRNVGRLDLLDRFASDRLTDFNLPFDQQTLPQFVQDEELREAFLEHQRYVLTDARDLEQDGGDHKYLQQRADTYFHRVRDLGQGAYGAVDHIVSKLSLRSYARKSVLRGPDSEASRIAQHYLIQEFKALRSLHHRHLVQYIGSYTDKQHIAFLMSPVADMDLRRYLAYVARDVEKKGTSLRYFFGCLAGAMEYLHQNGVIHRDIKPNNILVKEDRVFFSDFGTALVRTASKRSTSSERLVPRTAIYMAPEAARNKPRTVASDMWSLGVVFLEISNVLFGSSFGTFYNYLDQTARAKRREPYVWSNIDAVYAWMDKLRRHNMALDESSEILAWTRSLLQAKPKHRLDASRLMQYIYSSPSFCAYCCLDCRPQYHELADGPSFQSRSSPQQADVTTTTFPPTRPISTVVVQDEVTALFDSKPLIEPQADELERQDAVGSWLTSLAEFYDAVEAHPEAQYPQDDREMLADTTEESKIHFAILHDPTATMDGPGNPDTYTTDDNWRRVQAASDSHLPPEGTDRWQHEGIDLVEITASDERFMTAMSYPRHETTDRTVEPKTKGAGGQHLETDAALEPVIKLIEPKAYKGDDPGPQEIYPGFKTGQSRSVIRTHGAPSPWIHGETILGPQDPLRFVLIKSHKKQNKGVIEEAGQVPWKLKTKVFPPRVMEVEDNPASGQDGIDSTARSLVTSPVQKFNPQADQKTTHQAPNPRGRGVSALPVVDEEPTEVTTKPALEKVRGKRPKSKVRFSDGSPSGVPKPTDETPLEPDKKQDEPISKHRRRPQKPNESLLQAALHNAARAKEKAAAGSNSSAASSSVFSPEVYMENMWEAATTQATRDDRKEIMGLSLTRWLERDSHLLESVCRTGKPQVVRHLLSKGVNPGTRKKPRPTPLLLAVQGGTPQHYKCVQALLHRGVDLNVKHKRSGKTALHLAIETADFKGHTNLVRDLAAGGANPNIPDRTGELPIHAIFRGGEPSGPLKKHRLDALACILKVDICGETDVNVSEPHERHSPLHLAVAKTSPYAVGMLLYKGANVNAENAIRVTPLLLAATQWAGGPLTPDQEVVLDLLLKAPGIEVDRQAGGSGRTALHFAALHCAPAAVRLLLAKSASARGTDSKGMTPLELCATNDTSKWKVERDEIRALLR